jgi:hypothetical protein
MEIDLTGIPYLARENVVECLRLGAEAAYAEGAEEIHPRHMLISLAKATNTWSEALEDLLSGYCAPVPTSQKVIRNELRVSEPLKRAVRLASEHAQNWPIDAHELWGACLLVDGEFLSLYQRCYDEKYIRNMVDSVTTFYFGKPYTIRLPCFKLRVIKEQG